jgi:hypothetical protein
MDMDIFEAAGQLCMDYELELFIGGGEPLCTRGSGDRRSH